MDFDAIWMIWLRDLIRHFRDKIRLLGSITRPVLWLLIMGTGLRSAFNVHGISYTQFIFPGIIAMNLIFAAMISTISIIWDREFGFLREILVAPIPRSSIVLGKALSGSTVAFIEGLFVLAFAPFIKINIPLIHLLLLLPLMFLIAFVCTSLGIVIAARMTSFEGFGVISNFVIMPMFFLSGAMFPIDNLPHWISFIIRVNPLTYGVDLLRWDTLGIRTFALYIDFLFLIIFSFIMLGIGVLEFSKRS
ncbi:MAG: ABC transporter permease [Candidatus Omnitrophica bacterium]|nr:ABC transporter permease [Candidatus Omnitrophota bacterium]MDD5352763.1 ABC transporter permease [Candidatus Omnitrophota bacterium]MDD5550362.1 ABC transporter permease [Candidatus Omnitrophota bacterium]